MVPGSPGQDVLLGSTPKVLGLGEISVRGVQKDSEKTLKDDEKKTIKVEKKKDDEPPW